MSVKLIIPGNEYGSLVGTGKKTTMVLTEEYHEKLDRMSAGSKPGVVYLSLDSLQVLTGDGDIDEFVTKLVRAASFDYRGYADNVSAVNRLRDMAANARNLSTKLDEICHSLSELD